MTTVTQADLHALDLVKLRERQRLHTPPSTAYQAWQLVAILVRQDRRVPDDVAGAILETLGRAVFHVCPDQVACPAGDAHPAPRAWVKAA